MLEEKVAEVTRKINYYAKRLKDRPYVERRNKIEARLRELPAIDRFPDGGVERLGLLREHGAIWPRSALATSEKRKPGGTGGSSCASILRIIRDG